MKDKNMDYNNTKVAIIGLGYIGLPTATLIASKGIKVNGKDINPSVVKSINEGKLHFVETGLDYLLKEIVSGKLLVVTETICLSDIYIVVVPTPFKHNHQADISSVESAVNSIIPLLKESDLLIIESTSPVFTEENMAKKIFLERPELKDNIFIAHCPERVLPGNTLYDLEHNDGFIGGITPEAAEKACDFYGQFVKGELHKTNAGTAEMCKLVENSFCDVQIAFANEISMVCDR